jgi:hypothetical protein
VTGKASDGLPMSICQAMLVTARTLIAFSFYQAVLGTTEHRHASTFLEMFVDFEKRSNNNLAQTDLFRNLT